MISTVSYRPYVERDISQILNLWSNCSDFGTLTENNFRNWFLQTPFEKAEVIVAENEKDELIGQMVFIPTRMIVDGRSVKAMRIAAPIVNPDYRVSEFGAHPMVHMFLRGIEHARSQGFSIVYIFPARGWLRALEAYSQDSMKWLTATYNTFSVPIKASLPISELNSSKFYFKIAEKFNDEYDMLWKTAVTSLPVHCGIARQKDWLKYKLSGHCVVEARCSTNHSLLGYFAVKKKTGLLVDMLANSKEELKHLFWQAIEMLASMNAENRLIETGKVTGMYTDLMAFVLDNKEFELPDYKFDFGCCALHDDVKAEQIEPGQWHMMPDV
jgi:hypothetical protein